MKNNYLATKDFAINGVARNPLTSVNALKTACTEIRTRLDNGTITEKWMTRYTHTLKNAIERINNA